MTDSTTSLIQFIQSHESGIVPGDYEIVIKQEIETNDGKKIPKTEFPASHHFLVAGPRFQLEPQDVDSVFPPDGSLGDHSNVFPHAILNRSTLPWERHADKDGSGPWLAILLFEENEKPKPQVMTLSDLGKISGSPGFTPEKGQSKDDKVTVIDVKRSVLKDLLLRKSELAYLAHVRSGIDAKDKQVGGEQAVIIGNRLPARGRISTAHLVSLAGRYKGDDFNFENARDEDSIWLVSLKSWSFACLDARQDFKGLLADLNTATFRLPDSKNEEADKHLASGYVPIPHKFRQGSKSVSWYRGPLVPGESTVELSLPVRTSDELARYETSSGMFDASYAAAWELGRLLMLQNKRVSTSLYTWKRANAQQVAQQEQQLLHPLSPAQQKRTQTDPNDEVDPVRDPLKGVKSWFDDLKHLKDVPFNYLVPDERMLPAESIRFFWVDPAWVDCLLDGAFSIGRVTRSDHHQDKTLSREVHSSTHAPVTGFLLRSAVVAGWPGLIIEAYGAAQNMLNEVRRDVLSDSVLLVLFDGEVSSVKFHQKPEALHFGLDAPDSLHPGLYKKLRDDQGNEGAIELRPSELPWRHEPNRVIDVDKLAAAIKDKSGWTTFTSAQFALQMIEGGDEVTFLRTAQK